MQDREWARGLTQDQFHHEFQRRNPATDVIPDVNEWLAAPEPVYHGRGDLTPDAWEQDGPAPEPPKAVVFECRGCGKKFPLAIARSGHERGCKSKLKKGAQANAAA